MNDSMSILLATTILALGGLGLYMYKSSDDSKDGDSKEEKYNEENIFGSGSLFNWGGLSDDKSDDELEEIYDEDDIKPRRKNAKTQRNRKSTGSSRRRY